MHFSSKKLIDIWHYQYVSLSSSGKINQRGITTLQPIISKYLEINLKKWIMYIKSYLKKYILNLQNFKYSINFQNNITLPWKLKCSAEKGSAIRYEVFSLHPFNRFYLGYLSFHTLLQTFPASTICGISSL